MSALRYIVAVAASSLLMLDLACEPYPPDVPSGVGACVAFCNNAANLGCEEALPSPGGASCVTVCENYHARGYLRPYSECGAIALDETDMRSCGIECR